MKKLCFGLIGTLLLGGGIVAQKPPLLAEKDVAALANELSGETAKRNLEGIARFHRQRGSQGFHAAAELVAERLRAYGLSDVAILQFPADGKTFYGTQRSRPAWDAEVGELDIMEVRRTIRCGPTAANPNVIADCLDGPIVLHENYDAEPVVLAEDSETRRDAVGLLVDIGEGTKESDYASKNVKDKIVLVSAQPGAVQDLAVGKFGAVGIVSYAQNQKTAWWGEDANLIRWGHLETFSPNKTWAFMVSLKTGRDLRERLAKGQNLFVHADVKAGQHPGNYEVVTATIPGAEPKLKDEEIAFSCHLDHQRPGANDNASGCVTILEVARTLQKLIGEGKLARPARTIRFIFPPEIEGTLALLNAKEAKYDTFIQVPVEVRFGSKLAKRIKAVVHMDMVGGGPETKAVFHVTRGPMSLPSFVHDVAWAFAEWVNEESYKFAATGEADYPMVAPDGGKQPLRAEYSAYTMGSDHDVYQDSSFGIPAIYLNDWPDRYIHTNFDSAANIDPTKLKRVAFIGAASGYFLATFGSEQGHELGLRMESQGVIDKEKEELRDHSLSLMDQNALRVARTAYSLGALESLSRFLPGSVSKSEMEHAAEVSISRIYQDHLNKDLLAGFGILKFRRKTEVKGPLAVFGYDYFEAEWAKLAYVKKPQLLEYQGLWGAGQEYAYEVLNFADGKRNAQEIRDAVSAEYGPVPLELVVEYLKALEKIGVVEEVK
jgi:aminopeptidase YwaD